MLNERIRNSTLIALSGILAVSSAGCGNNFVQLQDKPAIAAPDAAATPAINKPPAVKPAEKAVTKLDTTSGYYDQALDTAAGAKTITEYAVNRDDWKLVASRWEAAISLLKAITPDNPEYAIAKSKQSEFQGYLAQAKQKASPAPAKTCFSDSNPDFFFLPIKGRLGTIPVVEVSFNDKDKFLMLFDTGASRTLITQKIASTLGVAPQGLALVGLADGSTKLLSTTKVKSIEADGRVKRDLEVALAPSKNGEQKEAKSNLSSLGLLGQDFVSGYDVTIKSNVIEFQRQSNQSAGTKSKVTSVSSCLSDVKPQFFSIPIKTRKSGLPIVKITFNDTSNFDMAIDTGASKSLITQSMANKLRLQSLGSSQVSIADGSTVTINYSRVNSAKASGRVMRDMVVWVAGSVDEFGLLGQDFFQGYDITIKQNSVEFRRQRYSS